MKCSFEVKQSEKNLQDIVKLPRIFNNTHLDEVAPNAFLCDPVGNMFEVFVQKRYNEAYFTQGWKNLGKFYGLFVGGWVRLFLLKVTGF